MIKKRIRSFFEGLLGSVSPFGDKGRYTFIEGLRGIAVLLVFNVHFLGQYIESNYFVGEQWPHVLALLRFFHAGHIGVDCFFIISGFLIYQVLAVSKKRKTFFGFIKKRYLRLLPVILVVVILPSVKEIRSIKLLVDNIFFLRLFKSSSDLTTVTWSLTYEVYFYILAGCWFLFIPKRISKNWLVLVALYLFVLVSPVIFTTHQIPQPSRFGGFFWGIFLGKLLEEGLANGRLVKARNLLFCLGVFLVVLSMSLWLNFGWAAKTYHSVGAETLFYLMAQIGFFLVMYACFHAPSSIGAIILSSSPLRYIGTISYSFYLVHLIGIYLSGNILAHFLAGKYLMIAQFPIGLGLTILMSHFSYTFLEKPYFEGHTLK